MNEFPTKCLGAFFALIFEELPDEILGGLAEVVLVEMSEKILARIAEGTPDGISGRTPGKISFGLLKIYLKVCLENHQ